MQWRCVCVCAEGIEVHGTGGSLSRETIQTREALHQKTLSNGGTKIKNRLKEGTMAQTTRAPRPRQPTEVFTSSDLKSAASVRPHKTHRRPGGDEVKFSHAGLELQVYVNPPGPPTSLQTF